MIFSDARGRAHSDEDQDRWGAEMLAAVVLLADGGYYTALAASDSRLQAWLAGVRSNQRINECESLAALLGLCSFSGLLRDADVMHFIDSSAAEGSLIKGYSASQTLAAIAGAYWSVASESRASIWIGRVPSKLNVADGPTRGNLEAITYHGWKLWQPSIVAATPWRSLLT